MDETKMQQEPEAGGRKSEVGNPMPDLRLESVVREHLPWVRRIAAGIGRRFGAASFVDDLAQEGLIGLLAAWHRFDARRGIQFRTFADPRVRGQMIDWIRENDPVGRSRRQREAHGECPRIITLSLDVPSRMDGESPVPFGELLEMPRSLDRLELGDWIEWLLAELDAEERRLLGLYYGAGLSMTKLAGRLGVSQGTITNRHRRIIAKIRRRAY